MTKVFTKFEDLTTAELRRSAIEDFAVDVGQNDNKAMVVAALAEGGVSWADYVAQHPEVAPSPEPVAVVTASAPVTPPVEQEPVNVVVASTPVYKANDKLLIKMTRQNPVFEVRGHRFTQENPYALVNPNDADYILSKEDGFRQALPSELQDFYN